MTEQPAIQEELKLLVRILREELFRFVLVEYNHASAIGQAEDFVRKIYPRRSVLRLSVKGNHFRSFSKQISNFKRGIVLIPDFEELFRPENDDFRIAFNQRRDWLAEQPIALLCFLPAGGLQEVMKGMPDFWSRRDAELNLQVSLPERSGLIMQESYISTIGGSDVAGKTAELQRLRTEIAATDPNNFSQLDNLYRQLLPLLEDLGEYKAGLEAAREYQHLASVQHEASKDLLLLRYAFDRMATFHRYLGQYTDAEYHARKALELAEESRDESSISSSQNNLALVLHALGDYEGAKSLLEKAVKSDEQHFGANHPTTAVRFSNLAGVLEALSDFNGAKKLLERVVESAEQHFGVRHPTTAVSYSNLASVLQELGDFTEAKSLLEKSIYSAEQNFGVHHPTTAMRYLNLATVLFSLQDYDKARPLLEKAQQVFLSKLGDKHPYSEEVKTWLAKLDKLEGKTD
jgi:tetratricopeptide (TPR) repeat protein